MASRFSPYGGMVWAGWQRSLPMMAAPGQVSSTPAPSSQMISSTVNWAVGDPRPENDRVEAEDGWQGTPLQITITSDARPSLPGADVEKVGDNRYVATFTPNSSGIYYIGNYGVAVNYPLEYQRYRLQSRASQADHGQWRKGLYRRGGPAEPDRRGGPGQPEDRAGESLQKRSPAPSCPVDLPCRNSLQEDG